MQDLIEFLTARLAEDERKVTAMQRERLRVETAPIFQGQNMGWLAGVDIFVNPDRWQAEIDLKRKLLEGHEPDIHRCAYGDHVIGDQCEMQRLLAVPYAGHPDFEEAWRP